MSGRAANEPTGSPGTDEATQWETGARVRADHPGWVVIWSRNRGECQARPPFRATKGTVAAGPTPVRLPARLGWLPDQIGIP